MTAALSECSVFFTMISVSYFNINLFHQICISASASLCPATSFCSASCCFAGSFSYASATSLCSANCSTTDVSVFVGLFFPVLSTNVMRLVVLIFGLFLTLVSSLFLVIPEDELVVRIRLRPLGSGSPDDLSVSGLSGVLGYLILSIYL